MDLRAVAATGLAFRARAFSFTGKYLQAATRPSREGRPRSPELAKNIVNADVLAGWLTSSIGTTRPS